MIEVVLFDADGVLISGDMFSVELERKHGITHAGTQSFYKGVFLDCLNGTKDLKIEIEPYLMEWGWQGTVQDFLDEWFEYENHTNRELIDYIQQLRARGIRCCVATNQEKYRSEYMMHSMGFVNHFDKFYASAYLGAFKPQAAFFESILVDLEEKDKQKILFWDDSATHIAGALACGIRAEHYKEYADFKEKMKQYV